MDVDDESFSVSSVLFSEGRPHDGWSGWLACEPRRVATFIIVTHRLFPASAFPLVHNFSYRVFFSLHSSIPHASLL